MSATGTVYFPDGFEHLLEHADWVLWTEEERVEKQVTTSVEDLSQFYNAVLPHAGAIYDHLEGVQLDAMSDADRALLCLGVAFAEIANGVEYYSPDSTAAEAMPRFRSSHDPLLGWRWASSTAT
jgi:hypothetical protein